MAERRAPFGRLIAELSQTRLVDMALMGDSLVVLIKEDKSRYARLLRVPTERSLAEPQLLGGCSHGADRIAVDADYVYLPCLGSMPAGATANMLEPSHNPDGHLLAIPLDGGNSRLLVPHARWPFWIGVDSSMVYWFDRHVLNRLPRPRPGVVLSGASPDRIAQRSAGRRVFVGSDGTYFQYGQDITRATPGHIDVWRVSGLSRFLGVSARNEIFVTVEGHLESVFRFVPASGSLMPVTHIDQPVMAILWLRDGSMLVRSQNTIWRSAVAAGASSVLWRHFPRGIVAWAADERNLYLALAGSPLDRHSGFSLYALPTPR